MLNWQQEQKELRERLMSVMRKHHINMSIISKELGINFPTISKFLQQDKKIQWKTFCRLSDFVVKYERLETAQR